LRSDGPENASVKTGDHFAAIRALNFEKGFELLGIPDEGSLPLETGAYDFAVGSFRFDFLNRLYASQRLFTSL